MEKDSITGLKGDAHSPISVLEDEVKMCAYAFPIVLIFLCITVLGCDMQRVLPKSDHILSQHFGYSTPSYLMSSC